MTVIQILFSKNEEKVDKYFLKKSNKDFRKNRFKGGRKYRKICVPSIKKSDKKIWENGLLAGIDKIVINL